MMPMPSMINEAIITEQTGSIRFFTLSPLRVCYRYVI